MKKKILIDCHQGIGDIVHMLPLIENARATYPKAYITLICSYQEQEVLLRPGLVNKFVYWKSLTLKSIQKIRKVQYDIAFLNVVTSSIKGTVFLRFVLGCHMVVSEFPFSLSTRHLTFVKANAKIHRVDRYLRLSDAGMLVRHSSEPSLMEANNAAKDKGIESRKSKMTGKGIIGICMGSGATGAQKGLKRTRKDVKQWPLENIVSLCRKLADSGYDVLLFGGKAQEYISREISNDSGTRIHDYIDACTLRESMDLISVCDVCVGVDTGLMHMAAALGRKTVTLFGPTSPAEFHPYSNCNTNITLQLPCAHCYGKKELYDCKSNDCMKGITVNMVFRECMRILQMGNGAEVNAQ